MKGETGREHAWVLCAKPPFGGPEQVLGYLGRFTHRVAISHDRLKTMAFPGEDLLRRSLLHVVPDGFVKIRHSGLLTNRGRPAKLARCRALLAAGAPAGPPAPETVAALLLRLTGVDITRCPVCRQGRLQVVGVLRPGALPVPGVDTS